MIGPENLHRGVKLEMDSGAATTHAEAVKRVSEYRLALVLGPGVRRSRALQVAALTIVNAGRRSFLGGVFVRGDISFSLDVPWVGPSGMGPALEILGAQFKDPPRNAPSIVLGGAAPLGDSEVALEGSANGWSVQAAPWGVETPLPQSFDFEPSGVLLGGLLLAEAFQSLRATNPEAGLRTIGISLWRPELDWRADEAVGSRALWLPRELWLTGLGQLGQAYLWTLGFLPYAKPGDVQLLLNDFDVLVEANDSTSLLTTAGRLGRMKTREMAQWAEDRGFGAQIIERAFGADFKIRAGDPPMLLSGTDSRNARADLEGPGFARVIDCGLGAGPREYLGLSMHTFPGSRPAADLFAQAGRAETDAKSALPQAYLDLASKGVEQCGIQEIAGRAVGVPFVGAVGAAFVISEAIRCANGWHAYEVVDLHLRNPLSRAGVPNALWNDPLLPVNPGITPSA